MTEAAEQPTVSTAPGINRRRLIAAVAVWIALVAGALGIAALQDNPPAPVEAAPVPEGLPPLALSLDRNLPAEVAALPTGAQQLERLRTLATTTDDPARWVELGAVYHRLQAYREAGLAYQRALTTDPERLDARVGLIMLDATTADGISRAAGAMADLQRANPDSQLVAFNRGMLAVYRTDRETLTEAFSRTVELGPRTSLGTLARRFLDAAGGQTKP